jgi:hypothetical protein
LDRGELGRDHPAEAVTDQWDMLERRGVEKVQVVVDQVVEIAQMVSSGRFAVSRMARRDDASIARETVEKVVPRASQLAVKVQQRRAGAGLEDVSGEAIALYRKYSPFDASH